jgi:acyl-ACP thioesterase
MNISNCIRKKTNARKFFQKTINPEKNGFEKELSDLDIVNHVNNVANSSGALTMLTKIDSK